MISKYGKGDVLRGGIYITMVGLANCEFYKKHEVLQEAIDRYKGNLRLSYTLWKLISSIQFYMQIF